MTDAGDSNQFAREQVDRMLAALPDPPLPPGLRQRVLSQRGVLRGGERPWSTGRVMRAFWPQLVGLAAASVLGFLSGVVAPGLFMEPDTDLTPYIVALDVNTLPTLTEETMP
ncbi:MAG: hypothetical protein D6763_11230 [Alphaproteobacteria bacterium]|nr:MAG: hypothetical protein D6763_11230 [Alphaproteobacteria bacterium]